MTVGGAGVTVGGAAAAVGPAFAGDSGGGGMDSGFRRNEVGGAGDSGAGLVFEEFLGVHYFGGVEGGFYGAH